MNKTELIRDMRSYADGSFINKSRIRKYYHRGKSYTDSMLKDVDYELNGKTKIYYVPDVVEAFLKNVIRGGV